MSYSPLVLARLDRPPFKQAEVTLPRVNHTPANTEETIFPVPRRCPETNACFDLPSQTTGVAMWEIVNTLYREYCIARLNEMRQSELPHD